MAARKKPEPQDSTVRFKLEGNTYEIDPEHLRFGEIEELEVYFDAAYDEIDFESMRGVMFLLYLARKRVEPAFSLDDMRKIDISSFEQVDESEGKSDGGSGQGTAGTPS